jgi:hypothetical protein
MSDNTERVPQGPLSVMYAKPFDDMIARNKPPRDKIDTYRLIYIQLCKASQATLRSNDLQTTTSVLH